MANTVPFVRGWVLHRRGGFGNGGVAGFRSVSFASWICRADGLDVRAVMRSFDARQISF